MTLDMKGKVALVTGGGSGIGRATALAFAKAGAVVAVADIASDNGSQTVGMIREAGSDGIFISCDVSKAGQVEAMVRTTVDSFGRLDYAFNNAGIEGVLMPITDYPEETWHRLMGINLTGVWLSMKYEIPQMLKQGGGAIVNTASVSGIIGAPGLSAYSASKHAVIGLTKTVALEYATAGIRVNAVCPGVIDTPMNDRFKESYPDLLKILTPLHPLGRIGTADEVANGVVWLCSDAASFVTGHAMVIDGGFVAQ